MSRITALAELITAGLYAAAEYRKSTSERDLMRENEYLRDALKDERERTRDLEKELKKLKEADAKCQESTSPPS